jgi:hypothetical protein
MKIIGITYWARIGTIEIVVIITAATKKKVILKQHFAVSMEISTKLTSLGVLDSDTANDYIHIQNDSCDVIPLPACHTHRIQRLRSDFLPIHEILLPFILIAHFGHYIWAGLFKAALALPWH